MEPVSAIIAAVLTAGSAIFGKLSSSAANRRARMPEWLSPADFQQRDRTVQYIILAIAVALIAIVLLVLIKKSKR
ncbi:MAG TPA: hypothetical protein VJ953_18565 [Saprospiraceae bacterium]|jgi:hypothetical protein|nr:hypothetical protein [Saprospiraceae bacterium]